MCVCVCVCVSVPHSLPQPQPETSHGTLRVNNGQLESPIPLVTVAVTNTMTASEIVEKTLIHFDLAEEDSREYCLVEVSQMEGVREKVLNDTECPWKSLQELRKVDLS